MALLIEEAEAETSYICLLVRLCRVYRSVPNAGGADVPIRCMSAIAQVVSTMEQGSDFVYDVFISYSHQDKRWVTEWLMPRLKEAGLRVCIDLYDFDIGVPSLVNMEQAAERSRHTLLVLTPAWVESEWTLFESLLIQTSDPAGRRQRIIPVLLQACEPPQRIAMLTYADLTEEGEREIHFKQVLKALKGKKDPASLGTSLGRILYRTANVPASIGRHILSFDTLIAEKTEGFVGRQFVFDALDAFMKRESCGYFVIRGEPGIGKSALMGQLVRKFKPVHHFNVVQSNIRSPEQFLSNVCSQLIARYQLSRVGIPEDPMKDNNILQRCLEAAAAKPANRPVLIAIDALDEADWRSLPLRVNIHYLPPELPKGVYIVATTRQEKDIPLVVSRRQNLDLRQDSEGNLLDIRSYLNNYVQRAEMQSSLAAWAMGGDTFVEELTAKSQGNFMYLHYVLPAIEGGRLGQGGAGELPEGLQAYYLGHWAEMKQEVGGAFAETHERVICVLAAMTEPVSVEDVADWTRLSRSQCRQILDCWEPFLFVERTGRESLYRVYHTSFAEFLGSQVDLRDYSDLVASAIESKIAQARFEP